MGGGSEGVTEREGHEFSAFYAAEFPGMVRLAFLLVGAGGDPEGVAQEAFARVQLRFDSLDSPRAYTRTVVVNLCRRQRRRAEQERAITSMVPTAEPGGLDPRELLDAIDVLPFRQRAVIVLRYYNDLSETAIAEALGCRPGTVKSLAHRALRQLRKDIEA